MKKFILFIFLSFSISIIFAQKGFINPSAKYCEMLGYQYETTLDNQGNQVGICVLPNGTKVNAWDFYKGKVAQEYSYGAKYGFSVETAVEKHAGYTTEYAVCVSEKKGKETRIPLLKLMELNGDTLFTHEERYISPIHKDATYDPNFKTAKSIPTSFDWRNKDGHAYIGGVRNQGSCGSCYAFGSTAAAEGTYNVATNSYDGDCADFAESYIIWCLGSMPQYKDHFGGCDGADYDYQELQALTDIGTVDESYFPYSDADNQSCSSAAENAPKIKFEAWHRVTCNDENAIKTAIMTYGVVDAAVYVTTDFQNYSGGVFSDASTTCTGSPCYNTTTNHAISLVGWGNDATEGDYWILRNSWDNTWGESGYMRIAVTSARVGCSVAYMEYTPASVITHAATNITKDAARLNGSVNPEGVATNYYFEYGLTDSYGTSTTPVSAGSGTDPVSVYEDITGLGANTLYHYRVVATNSAKEIIYGNDMTFTTLCNTITTFPYFVGFEEATGNDFTNCWETKSNSNLDGSGLTSTSSAGGDNTWFNNNSSSFGGSGGDYIRTGDGSAAIGYTAGQTGDSFNWLISPDISLVSSSELTFWVWYYNDATYYTNFYVQIYTISNGWVNLLTWTEGDPSNQFNSQVVIDISAYDEQTVKIAFVYEYTDGYQMAIDDFQITGSVTSPPVADFSGTPLTIPAGSTVDFTDLSTNTPTSWSWTFTGGTPGTSSVKNPAGIAYNTPGIYNVSLKATNGIGNDTETKTNYITVTNPVIEFVSATTNTTESTSAGSGCREYTDIPVTVKVTGKPDVDETVTISVTGGTAVDPADYEITTSMPITCSAGSDANKTVTFRIYDDAAIENAETIDLSMTLGGASCAVLGSQTTHTITINDNDTEPVGSTTVTIWSEDFSSPSDWNKLPLTNKTNRWYITSSCDAAINGPTAQIIQIDATGTAYCGYQKDAETVYIWKEVNATDLIDLTASFNWKCLGNTGDYGKFVYSTDGASTWNDVDATVYSGQSTTQSVTNLSLPASLDGTTFLIGWAFTDNGDNTQNQPPFAIDDIVIKGTQETSVCGTLDLESNEYLGPNSTVYFYDDTNDDLMAKIENTTSHDYGCTTVAIDRAGTGAVELFYDGTAYPDSTIIEKTFLITPTTNNISGIYNIRFYYSADEINGWLAVATNNVFNDLTLIKTGGSISNITPGIHDGNGNTNYLATSAQRGTFGSSYYVQGTFNSGFSGFGSGKIGYIPKGAGSLPIELLSFKGKYNNYKVILNWTTASEINNDYFTIERSKNAVEFQPIKFIEGAGNSNNILNYEVTDINPFSGTSYYRLKQTDFNGKYSYSNIVSVNDGDKNIFEEPFNYYVNNQFMYIKLNENYFNMKLVIADIAGRKIFNKNIPQLVKSEKFKINIGKLEQGFYNFILFNNTKKFGGKFIIK